MNKHIIENVLTISTATNGQALRDYAEAKRNDPAVSIFPENGLCANEQAEFLIESAGKFSEIITFSPYIISESVSNSINIVDKQSLACELKFGSSINKVSMKLWRKLTIGAANKIESYRELISKSENAGEIEQYIDTAQATLGDSVELMMFLHWAHNNLIISNRDNEYGYRRIHQRQ